MTETPRNPFLPPAAEPVQVETVEPDAVLGDEVDAQGPSSPVHAPRPGHPSAASLLNEEHQVPAGVVSLVGLHGGAGVSTLAALLGEDVADGGSRFPDPNPYLPTPRAVLVARTHARGLEVAERITTAWSHREIDGVDVLGLVLVDDGPRIAAPTRQVVARLLRMTPHGWHIPWVEAWRTASSPSLSGVRLPRTIKSIRRAVGAPASSKGNA